MKRFKDFKEHLDEAKAGETCNCCDNKIDENGKCGCGPDCEHCGGQHDMSEAAPKISKGKAKGSISATGIRGKGMKKFDVNVAVQNGKFEFRITDETGKFQTVNIKQAAKMLGEEVELDEAMDQKKFSAGAKAMKAYAQKNGGVDKKDFMEVSKLLDQIGRVNILQAGQLLSRLNRLVDGMDTDVRERIFVELKKVGLVESVELDEVLDTPKAMDSYRNKAKYSRDRASGSATAKILSKGTLGSHKPELDTMRKRHKGMDMADRNAARKTRKALMNKEEVELDEARGTSAKYAGKSGMFGGKYTSKDRMLDMKSFVKTRNKRAKQRDAEHAKQDPKMRKMGYAKHMLDTDKADNKARKRGIDPTGKYDKYKKRNGIREELDEATINAIAAEYINENNITLDELENMTEAELNELIGKAIGGAFKVGAKAAVGAARLAKRAVVNKQGNIRGTKAAKQDKAGDRAEKEAKKREAEYNRKKRIQDAEKKARDMDKKISAMKSNKP